MTEILDIAAELLYNCVMAKDAINVYWSSYSTVFNFSEPTPVMEIMLKNRRDTKNIHDDPRNLLACPASNDFFKNLFSINSTFPEKVVWPEGYLKESSENYENNHGRHTEPFLLKKHFNLFDFKIVRPSSMNGYVDIEYLTSAVFFADEPLIARFMAPNYPPTTPSPGAFLASGQFDIGQWFRPFNLNYFIPVDNTTFEIKHGDPIFYLQLLTDKKINFHKFKMTPEIAQVKNDTVIWGDKVMSLPERYDFFNKGKNKKKLLEEINKNLY